MQLEKLKRRVGNPEDKDLLLLDLLEDAKDIICDIRNSNEVEEKYLGIQVRIATEMYNKIGAEGQIGHSESGLSRTYEQGDVSDSLIRRITPVVKTPFSEVRDVR